MPTLLIRNHGGGTAKRSGDRGQALVEFSLILIPLALLLLGMIQLATIFSTQIGITNAARDAARLASVLTVTNPVDAAAGAQDVYDKLTTDLLPANVSNFSSSLLVPGSGGTQVCYLETTTAPYSASNPGVIARVKVVYRHALFVPLIGGILDGIDGTPNDGLHVGTSIDVPVGLVQPYTITLSTTPTCYP